MCYPFTTSTDGNCTIQHRYDILRWLYYHLFDVCYDIWHRRFDPIDYVVNDTVMVPRRRPGRRTIVFDDSNNSNNNNKPRYTWNSTLLLNFVPENPTLANIVMQSCPVAFITKLSNVCPWICCNRSNAKVTRADGSNDVEVAFANWSNGGMIGVVEVNTAATTRDYYRHKYLPCTVSPFLLDE